MCVLFLLLVFRFGVDIRSLNSSLFDFIFHGQILKLFSFNSERILFFSQNRSYFYSCSGLMLLNIPLVQSQHTFSKEKNFFLVLILTLYEKEHYFLFS